MERSGNEHTIRSGVTRTHCPYCALQCGLRVERSDGGVLVHGDEAFPVNRGGLCVKGWTAGELLDHPERLREPLARDASGALVPVSWDDALGRVARAVGAIQAAHGPAAVGLFGGGSLTNEKAYLLGKLARVALRTPHIDYNGRFCMSSAAAASMRAFGLDRGLPFPLADLPGAEVILLAGSNPAETMPPVMQYFEAQRAAGGQLIVADPRRTPTAAAAALHLQLTPGTDAALANGLLHVLVRERLVDEAYIRARTEGWDAVRSHAATYWPERVERITGVPQGAIVRAAWLLGRARTSVVLTARGPEQQTQGVANTLAFINLALALGQVGRLHGGYGCLTGQGNGQGGREHGQKSDQLPGYRRIDDTAAREHIAAIWGVEAASLPGPGRSAFELLDALGPEGGVRGLIVLGSNVAVSAPDAGRVRARLASLDFLAVADFFLSETAAMADVVLPAAQWAEEEGTLTNLEGRVIRRRAVVPPPAGVRTDLDLICALGRVLGAGAAFTFADAEAVFDELRRASAGGPADYAGITYARIDRDEGVFWPCPDEAHAGTPRPFAERFALPGGRARFHVVRHQSPAETPDADYPFHLTTGRLLAQYQSGTQTRRVRRLAALAPAPTVELHPAAARTLGLGEGDTARVVTRRGEATLRVRLTPAIRPDTLFVPFHWGGAGSANRLTNPALDPISRMPEFKVCAARLERGAEDGPETAHGA